PCVRRVSTLLLPPSSPLFPYTTLFRSMLALAGRGPHRLLHEPGAEGTVAGVAELAGEVHHGGLRTVGGRGELVDGQPTRGHRVGEDHLGDPALHGLEVVAPAAQMRQDGHGHELSSPSSVTIT